MKTIYESLLYEEESSSIDFKEEQYKFYGQNEYVKFELLKDILAFANAWRRQDAYILIGVREVKGGKNEVIGIDEDIDDADLQQFVNQKTQRPVNFYYKSIMLEGRKVGVIFIGDCQRPIYLKKDYGKLKQNLVYLRRGSSTDVATPDEIFEMGSSSVSELDTSPCINLEFLDISNREILGDSIEVKCIANSIPDLESVPDYASERVSNTMFVPFVDFRNKLNRIF